MTDFLTDFIPILVVGVSLGSLYGLVGLGFTVIVNASQLVNFAQGDFAMVPMFIMLGLFVGLCLPFWISFLITMLACALMGYLFERLIVRKLWDGGVLVIIVGTLGLSGTAARW